MLLQPFQIQLSAAKKTASHSLPFSCPVLDFIVISWSGSRVTRIVLQQRSELSSKLSLNYWWVDVSGINADNLNIFRFESKSDLVMFHVDLQNSVFSI